MWLANSDGSELTPVFEGAVSTSQAVGNLVFFVSPMKIDGVRIDSLWRTDGSTEGTFIVDEGDFTPCTFKKLRLNGL